MAKKKVSAIMYEFVRQFREDDNQLANKESLIINFKSIQKVSDIFTHYWFDVREYDELYQQDMIDMLIDMYDNPDDYEVDYRIGKQNEQ